MSGRGAGASRRRSRWSADAVRQEFLDYFAARDHAIVPSSSLVPGDDPTLLFTNAGMNQFKEVFLGREQRPYRRAATVQKCMRVSGKHNDLDNVGPSTRHHTFFEMLGNFSFGDYFKAEAIRMAWELLTDGYGLPPERLWASVYEEDDEAYGVWLEAVRLPPGRVVRLGKDENFWAMGEVGPCGPCSEVHYDHGPEFGCGRQGCAPGCGCGRFVELWNLVFMEYNCDADGRLEPLPSPNIDTGAGLERLAAVLQGVRSNYDTDLFRPLIDGLAARAGCRYGAADGADAALRAIVDHGRALAFLLADGVTPANEGRGYVLRRLLRRAVRFGLRLGFKEPFLHEVAAEVVARMGHVYPELRQAEELVGRLIRSEEERFLQTLAAGQQVFARVVADLRGRGRRTIPGAEAFRLYDTYGFPLDLTRELAREQGLAVDEGGFQEAMERQRARARAAWKGAREALSPELLRRILPAGGDGTAFVGYDRLELTGARVLALVVDGEPVESLEEGQEGHLVVERTPFYAEAGGQVGDRGTVEGDGFRGRVEDAQWAGGAILHRVRAEAGKLRRGERVDLRVDGERRARTMRNHTATHLLHAALRERLGEHVRQAGSLVAPERLRFDFTHYGPLSEADVRVLEERVNEVVRDDRPVQVDHLAYQEALERGALAFFGEKYGERVRVVTVPGFSMELCGGTHVARTGQVGTFVITREESVAAGTRRIEALTGEAALALLQRYREVVRQLAADLNTSEGAAAAQARQLVERLQQLERELQQARVRLASQELDAAGVEVRGVRVVAREVPDLDAAGLRDLADRLKAQLGSGVVVLGARRDGKAQLVVGVTADLADQISAEAVAQPLARILGGGGGGHREMAQAGGPAGERLGEALGRAASVVAELLE